MKENKTDSDIMYKTVIIFLILLFFTIMIYQFFLKNYIKIPECIFYSKFGVYCPGCGCTRAFIELLKFNFAGSIKYNPTVIYASVLVAIYLITQTLSRIFKNRRIYTLQYNVVYIYIGIALLVITCIIKNIIKFMP